MTLQEARKVIGLNIHNLNGSMQMAVATIMDALEEKAEIIGHLQPSEDLEEAAEDGARQNYVAGGYSPFPNIEYGAYKNGFIAGAEWQKEQMLKDAVDGFIFQAEDYYPKQLIAGYDGELGMGDKVKILIIPETEDKK
jgi:iron uptake system EfeUOB component EfeO/EfeM